MLAKQVTFIINKSGMIKKECHLKYLRVPTQKIKPRLLNKVYSHYYRQHHYTSNFQFPTLNAQLPVQLELKKQQKSMVILIDDLKFVS